MGYCTSSAYSGKLVQLSYFLGCVDTAPDPEDYVQVGWRRDLAFSVEIGDSDATTAGTEGSIRTYIQTFKDIAGDFSGIANRDAALKTLRRYMLESETTAGWVRFVIPDEAGAVEVIEMQVIFTNYGFNTGYEDPATNDVGFKAVAVPIITDVPSYTIVLDPTTVSFVSGVGDTVDVEMSDPDVDSAVSVKSSAVGLTATVNNDTNIITLASAVVGTYTVTVTSLVNNKVTAVLPVTVTSS